MADLLIIDDDSELSDLVVKLLSERGHRVEVARTCAEARLLVLSHRFDLLIVDGLLPDGSGTNLLLELRRLGQKLPAMFVSSSWQEVTAVASQMVELGVARVLRKPIDPTTLPVEITYALHRGLPEEPTSDAANLLGEAIAQFREKLTGRVSDLKGALAKARTTAELKLLTPIHAEAHKLHGTAGSFGYGQLGTAAGVIEGVLFDAVASGIPLGESGWSAVDAAMTRMAAGLSDVTRPSEPPQAPLRTSVLIVEDDLMLLRNLAADFSVAFDVHTASDASSALEMARRLHPTCVIIDVHLGAAHEGFELAKTLRSLPGSENLPILFISADSTLDTQVRGLHAGGALFLSKPLSMGPLLDAVRRLTEVRARQRPRVVLLDDDAAFCGTVQNLLRGEAELHVIHHEAQALETLATMDPALLLLDVRLQGMSGLDICRMLRANARWENLDIVLVTADTSIETRIAAFRAGASDYVSKPVVPEELVARVMSRVERHHLRETRTTYDNLTGLMIRGAFAESFNRVLKLSQRNRTSASLCLLDLDRFKSINDRYGHMSGDRVLATLGQLLNRRFRGEDLRCRWGGEEIVLALVGSTRKDAKLALERLLAEFQSITFDDGKNPPYHATFSAGVASFPEDGSTLDELVTIADTRMYQGKNTGRARVIAD